MKKNKKISCCDMMDYVVNKTIDDIQHYGDIPIHYEPKTRLFSLRKCPWENEHKGKNIQQAYAIEFCPFCGKKIIKDLATEWSEMVAIFHKKNCTNDESCIPAEFQTDEWWKKRGL
jgi:RNA polymerase subunit RPABC4/transcription elongation factor Spt4